MYRHERPQKGRYRQFIQLGVETYGMSGPDIDAELILIMDRLWKKLGIRDKVRLQLNSLGTIAERLVYRETLVTYFQAHLAELDEDSLRRLETNPLRILDTKNPAMQRLVAEAPELMAYLGAESLEHFNTLTATLDDLGISYEVTTRLVRGLDYYSKTVFEWVTDELGSQGTVCAGGRYDSLIEQLGGKPNFAVGFAMGIERLLALMEVAGNVPLARTVDVYMIRVGETAEREGLRFAETIRNEVPGLKLQVNCGGGSFKSQFKKADKIGAEYAIILGEDEVSRGEFGLKSLRSEQDQQTLSREQIITFLQALCGLS
jgi:histidyl-tRNA synthetase